MTNRGKKITTGIGLSALLIFALPFLANPSACYTKPAPEEPPLWSMKVTCPFAVIDETFKLDLEGGVEWNGGAVSDMHPSDEPCPGHTLEIRRE